MSKVAAGSEKGSKDVPNERGVEGEEDSMVPPVGGEDLGMDLTKLGEDREGNWDEGTEKDAMKRGGEEGVGDSGEEEEEEKEVEVKSSPVKLTYRSRGRRAALLPNTMTAKLVEQAAARHNIKRKAEEEGRKVW